MRSIISNWTRPFDDMATLSFFGKYRVFKEDLAKIPKLSWVNFPELWNFTFLNLGISPNLAKNFT